MSSLRLRTWPSIAAAVVLILGICLLVYTDTIHAKEEKHGVKHQAADPGTVVTLDPGIGNMTFQVAEPPLPGTKAGVAPVILTASQAVAAFEQLDPDFNPPDDATYTYGYYTARIDSSEYRFQNAAAWGISYHLCAPLHNPRANSDNTKIPCTRWVFLDAHTGALLEAAWAP